MEIANHRCRKVSQPKIDGLMEELETTLADIRAGVLPTIAPGARNQQTSFREDNDESLTEPEDECVDSQKIDAHSRATTMSAEEISGNATEEPQSPVHTRSPQMFDILDHCVSIGTQTDFNELGVHILASAKELVEELPRIACRLLVARAWQTHCEIVVACKQFEGATEDTAVQMTNHCCQRFDEAAVIQDFRNTFAHLLRFSAAVEDFIDPLDHDFTTREEYTEEALGWFDFYVPF